MDHRFRGQIAGLGSSSGVRVVVGLWRESPLGAFADVMIADDAGRRHLLAPNDEVAGYVSATYHFDEVATGPVRVDASERGWQVDAPGLALRFTIGGRRPIGRLLRLVPSRVAGSAWWTSVTDPVARVAMRGVRTRGTAGGGRREFYGATDLHAVTGVRGSWQGLDLGTLAPVDPEPGFGFGSTPRAPSVTDVVTTVRLPDREDAGGGPPPSARRRR